VRRLSLLSSFIHKQNKPIYNSLDKTRDKEIDIIFLFHKPEIYFEVVRGLIMFIALCWALFLTNFIVAASNLAFVFFCLMPTLFATALYIFIVIQASLLMAVHSIDTDAVLEVLEQTEGSRQLGEHMRNKIIDRLKEMGEPQAELYTLFREIDDDGNGNLRSVVIHLVHSIEKKLVPESSAACDAWPIAVIGYGHRQHWI
jgi:hypothetical protein